MALSLSERVPLARHGDPAVQRLHDGLALRARMGDEVEDGDTRKGTDWRPLSRQAAATQPCRLPDLRSCLGPPVLACILSDEHLALRLVI